MTYILGISALYHDSAAALLCDGKIIAAAQEERFTRRKHDPGFPEKAIEYVLAESGVTLADVDNVVFYDKPFLKFERLIETYIAVAPRGFNSFRMAMPVWLREKLFLKDLLNKQLRRIDPDFSVEKILFTEHHVSHAASAFYPSPFEEAIVLTVDGVGEWATTTVGIGRGNDLTMVKELHFPHSLGLLYSAFTYYTGFKVNSGEYKVMGLAPYGVPQYKDLILEHLVDLKEDGSFRLNQKYFNYTAGLTMTNKALEDLFGHPVRKPETEQLSQFHMDIAASVQAVTEEIMLRITRDLAREHGIRNLCMAGGVALNCVANGKILRDGAFDNVWVQPAAGDAGGALGAAYAAWHQEMQQPREVPSGDQMQGSYLGPLYEDDAIAKELIQAGAKFSTYANGELVDQTAQALADGKAVGWFQGRMEFGPRALGARSILGDPRSESMQKTLNLKVKYRESFRPFAPSVLSEDVSDWFELDGDSPYMLIVADVQDRIRRKMTDEENALFGIDKLNVKRSDIPAVTHVDYSARIQTVHKETNPAYHALISKFKDLTGCSLVVNTSFNVRGEPIVCTPTDAFRCFMGTDIEVLSIGNCLLRKEEQDPALRENYETKYELD
ncbi:carbamoyltransferase [uncultured Ruegeria sp.]|uniref:carbamoyltransferase family protein n=1 Tax=uncultured Ruegeria sp. TaxID=259304 RepID=UPI0026210C16|nr:carbamoyltransferase [uncultured Ruegeria sp.]